MKFAKMENLIGNTPALRIIENSGTTVWLKMENFNPTGSMKDRVALFALRYAADQQMIHKGYTIIVPTSGNLGIAFSALCAEMGYKCICVVENNISATVENSIKSYGAKVHKISNTTIWSSKERLSEAYNLSKKIPKSWVFNQYDDITNTAAHYYGIGRELVAQFNDIDWIIVPVSTGGTISGISLACKEEKPNVKIIAIEPTGSTIFTSDKFDTLQDSTGLSFESENIKISAIDYVYRVDDLDAFDTCKKYAMKGIFAGDSTGASIFAVEELIKKNRIKGNVVIIMPDGGEKYIDLFYDINWEKNNEFKLQENKEFGNKIDKFKELSNKKYSEETIRKVKSEYKDFSNGLDITRLRKATQIYDLVGNTPLVKLSLNKYSNISNVYLKLEKYNPGGSAKDRAAMNMINEAEYRSELVPNMRIVESSSGNTGIALSMFGSAKDYKVSCIVESETSKSKTRRITVFGGELISVPANPYSISAVNDRISLAMKLKKENKNIFVPFQYGNQDNPKSHYLGTGKEISDDLGNVDCFISNISTGGTITGCAKKLKKTNQNTIIVGVEPEGSIIFGGDLKNSYIEGAGLPFVPGNLDESVIDVGEKVNDIDAFYWTRYIAKTEGISIGISTGALIKIAIQYAKELGPGKNIVVLAHDGGERYLDTVFDNNWIQEHLPELFEKESILDE